MDSGPDFVQNYDFNRDFHKNLIFFENFLRNWLLESALQGLGAPQANRRSDIPFLHNSELKTII